MGAHCSSNKVARARQAAELERQRAALEAEKTRLEQVALAQYWAEMRLQEEQRQKEAVERWRREQHLKTERELQRKMEELKMQQRLQTEQQQILQHQRLIALAVEADTWASTSVRETVPVQQRVSPVSRAGDPSDTRSSATAAPSIPLPRSAKPSKTLAYLDTNRVTVAEPSVLTRKKPKPNKKHLPETYVTGTKASAFKSRCEEWSIVDYVTEENGLNKDTAANVIMLLDYGYTVSFIADFRREMTQGLKEDELRNFKESYDRAKVIKQRAESIIKKVEKQGKSTPELHAFVRESKSLRDLDRIDSMFEVAEKNKDVELEKIAEAVVRGRCNFCLDGLVNPAIEGRGSVKQVKDGIVRILADTIKKDIRVFDIIKETRSKYEIGVTTSLVVMGERVTLEQVKDRLKYLPYKNFKSTDKLIAHTDIANIMRGEAKKLLTVKITVPSLFYQAFKYRCLQLHIAAVKASPVHEELISAAIDCMYDKWARPSVEKWTREEIDQKVEIATMSFDDLTTETVLTGEVCNIKPYGAFVNVRLERPGLIHKKNLNGITLSIGQQVETIVDYVDKERRMFGLRFLRCI